MDSNTILFTLLALMLTGYAILDGFDLGVGALTLLARSKAERDLQIATIDPVWDGNEAWLLAAGDVLFGAFPPVFALIFSGFYVALMLMLVGLIARAVAIKFRHMHSSPGWIRFWDLTLGIGSLAIALLVGLAAGNVLRGLPVGPDAVWEGNLKGLLNPYAVLAGVVVCALFVSHGAVYLYKKTEGPLSDRYRRVAQQAYGLFLLLYAAILVATAYSAPALYSKAGSFEFWGLCAVLAVGLAAIPWTLRAGKKAWAFLASSASIALIIAATAFSAYPTLVPSSLGSKMSLTIYNAASAPSTLTTMTVIACIGLPVMLSYTYAVYRIFKGPTRLHDGHTLPGI